MTRLLFFGFILLASVAKGQSTEPKPETNVIYGTNHIFTIETPEGWVNDKQYAIKIGMVSFFYPKLDTTKGGKVHLFAMGYDKDEYNKDLTSFVNGDLETFKKKYPDFTHEKIDIRITGGIINAVMYSFGNLSDRFKEEVVYLETDSSVLVITYAASSEQNYLNYQPVFDNFLASFNYRGTDPKPYLEWLKSRK